MYVQAPSCITKTIAGISADILKQVPSVNSLAFPANNSEWIDTLSPVGAARKFVESDRRGPLPSWMTRSEFDARVKLFEAGGYTGPNNWYVTHLRLLPLSADASQVQGSYPKHRS